MNTYYKIKSWAVNSVVVLLMLALTACGGDSATTEAEINNGSKGASYLIGGEILGLESDEQVEVRNNSEHLSLATNGSFNFSVKQLKDTSYNVVVTASPSGKICQLDNETGVVNEADITNVVVNCTMAGDSVDSFNLGGTLTGGGGGSITLANNGATPIELNADGLFKFSQKFTAGSSYSITVIGQPDGLTCEVENGIGIMTDFAIDNIEVSCLTVALEDSFIVGGVLAGLESGLITLTNNGVNTLELHANGAFTFSEKIISGDAYDVSFGGQPTDHSCEVLNGSGIIENMRVNNVTVNCIAVGIGQKFINVNNQYSNDSIISSTFKVVSSTDNSPVLGLDISGLLLREDNSELSSGDSFIDFNALDEIPLALKTLFMVDISANTTAADVEHIKQWLKDIVFDISKGTHNLMAGQTIAITTFDSSIINRTGFTSDVDQLLTAIEGIRKGGAETNLYGAMLDGLADWTDSVTSSYINHGAMVLLTANDDSRGLGTLAQVQQAALTKDVFIIPVGDHVNQDVFPTVVPENRVFAVTDYTQLENAFSQIEANIKNVAEGFYHFTYATKARSASHSFNLSLKDNQYTGNGHDIDGSFSAIDFNDITPEIVIKQHANALSNGESLRLDVNTRWSHKTPNYSWSVISGANLVTLSDNESFATLQVEAGPAVNTTFTVQVTDNENNVSKIESIAITPLKTPQDVSVIANYQQVKLSWSAVEGASHYLVYWSEFDDINSASSFKRIDSGEETIIDDLQNAQEYYFTVASVENYQQSKPSALLSATPFINKPAGLKVSTLGNINTLEWEPVIGVASYRLVIMNLTTNTSETIDIATGDSKYIHGNISSGQMFSYSLIASDGGSNSQAATTSALSAPVINALDTASTSSLNISWQPVTGAESYVISYAEKTLAGTGIFSVAGTVETNAYSLKSLVSGKQYVIKVMAIKEGAESVSAQSALLYQPVWSAGSDLPSARQDHTSNLIDGKIYLIGGFGAAKILDVYDSALGQWSTGASLRNEKINHTSSVINGRVYVVGGFGTAKTLQIYDPSRDLWYAGASLNIGRNLHSATVIDGKLYVVGGDESSGAGASSSLEIYDPVGDSWSLGAQLNVGRTFHTSTQMDGKLYVVGGRVAGEYSNSVEIYDPVSDSWSEASALNAGRYQHTTTAIDGKLYAVGGFADINFQNSLEIYDPVSGSWTLGAFLEAARYSHTSELIDNKLYVIAGRVDGINSQSIEIYDLATQNWSESSPIEIARDAHTSAVIDGKLHIIGGKDVNDDGLPSMEVYDKNITPLNPEIVSSGAAINLTWPGIPGVDEYRLHWNTTGAVTADDDVIIVNGINKYRHGNLSRNINHYYRLSWVIEGEEVMLSNQVSSLVRIVKPSSLVVSVNGAINTLNWDSVAGATSYQLLITNLATNVQQNIEILANAANSGESSFEHRGFEAGQMFTYSLTASDGEYTTQEASITSTAGLSIVSAESISSSSIDLRWSPVAGADSYTILYAEKNLAGIDTYTEVATTNGTFYVIEGLVEGKQYAMKVTALGEGVDAEGNMTALLHLPGWSEGAALTKARRTHTSNVFDDKIYVIGGYTRNLEIFDPLSNSWIAGTSSAKSRSGHSTTQINNKLYVVGGWGAEDSLGIYDPATDSWSQGASLNKGRYFHTSTLIDGKLYVAGGSGAEASLEIYDPATDSWMEGASLTLGRQFHTSSIIDGKLYIVAGRAGAAYVDSVEVYDPATDSWEQAASLTTGRYAHSSTVFNGKLYIVGGSILGGYTTSVEIYDSVNDSWSAGAPLNIERTSHTSHVIEGMLYAIAGSNRYGQINTVDVYDLQANSWQMGQSLSVPRDGHTSNVVDGKIYAIAGKSGISTLASLEIYDRNASPLVPGIKAVNGAIDLTWPAITGVSEYRLYWNQEGSVSNADAMISIDAANSTYQHRALVNGSAYYYRLSWVIDGEEIVLSNEISAIPAGL